MACTPLIRSGAVGALEEDATRSGHRELNAIVFKSYNIHGLSIDSERGPGTVHVCGINIGLFIAHVQGLRIWVCGPVERTGKRRRNEILVTYLR